MTIPFAREAGVCASGVTGNRDGRLIQPMAADQEAPVRAYTSAVILMFIVACLCPPLAAQGASPTFLFLMEDNGAPTGTIHVFRVNGSTGALTEAPGSPFNAGLIPRFLTVDPTGRFLYVGNQLSLDVTAFSIDASSGALAELPGSPYPLGGQAGAMGVEPTGRFLYVAVTGAQGQALVEFAIDGNTGVLTPAPASPQTGLFATSFMFNPNKNFAYLSTGFPGPGIPTPILVCTINFASGMLAPVGAAQPLAGSSSTGTISSGGSLLYSLDPSVSELDAFAIGSGGTSLAEASGSPYPVPNNPASLVVHPSGNFLYVLNQNQAYQSNLSPSEYDGSIAAFVINAGSGSLTPVSGPPVFAGINPLSIVVDPTGRFAYAAATNYAPGSIDSAQIWGFSIDPVSGILTPLSGTPWMDSGTVSSTGAQLAISPGALTSPNPAPTISSLSPASTNATGLPLTLQVNGTNFVPGSTVYFGGQARVTTYVSSSQLSTSILASDIDNGGTAVVFVFNPLPGGGASTSVGFPVFNPVPMISSLSPNSVVAGTIGVSLAVVGSNFVTSSVISFNGTPLTTSYSSPTIVTAAVPVALILAQGTASIMVTNPPNVVSDGGTSNTLTWTILPISMPLAVTSISPTSMTAGGAAFTLTVNGSGFVPGSQITFKLLSNFATTFVNSGQLTAVIPASDIAVAGNPYVIVNNPDGLASTQISFAVTNPQAGIGSVTPPSLPVGSSALTLTVTGTGFVPGTPGVVGSQVFVNGSPRPTTFVSSTVLQATLLPSDLSQTGPMIITVVNPFSPGGTTQPIQVPVTDFSVSSPASVPPISAGQTANILLSVSPVGGSFSYPVTISVSGLPLGVTASFDPSGTITPGATPKPVTLSISTRSRSAGVSIIRGLWSAWILHWLSQWAILFLAVALALCVGRQRPRIAVGLMEQSARQLVPSISVRGLALFLLVAMAGIFALQQGCGITGSSSASVSAPTPNPTPIPPANIAGGWSISTTSSKFPFQTTIAGMIAQNGPNISGSLNVSGSSCATTAILSGALSANALSASLSENGQVVALTGTVSPDTNSASGSYTAQSGGCTNGDAGSWSASRTAIVSNLNGTPAGTYPLVVTATSGAVSHSASVTLTVM